MIQKIIGPKQIVGPKILVGKIIFVLKNFGFENILDQINMSKKICLSKKKVPKNMFWAENFIGRIENFGPKNLWSERKIFSQKKIWPEIFF